MTVDATDWEAVLASDDEVAYRREEHDQVGTVEVQILLSWYFETSSPNEVMTNLRRAA